ncbi:MAG: glycoside hydrolase family 3 C-terminal domain-containing protein [Alphaproteobacteria bacterium]
MRWKLVIATAMLALAGMGPSASAQQQAAAPAYLNPSLPPEQRAADLVSRMTLEEKAAQAGHTAPAIPRLGVPAYNWWNEGLHGVARAGTATVFPQAIGMAASWDPQLMQQSADVISTEFRAKYAERVHPDGSTDWYRGLTVWSPNINIFRDPRWGRGQETYGEDPYLTSQIGIAFIRGLQGDDPNHPRVIATSKHFAVHSGPEATRHQQDMHPSTHDLEDTYLVAFRATVTQAHVGSVMCAYNALDDVPACANPNLLQTHLRQDWGFQGYVVSDCGAAANIYRADSLHFVPTPEQGAAAAFKAGMDVICGDYRAGWNVETQAIINAVHQGLLPEATLDQALRRLFAARYRLGVLDPPAQRPFANITAADNDTSAHHQMAEQMARASIVLLKNQGNLLPLHDPGTIAVVGPNADSLDALVGNYYGSPSHPVTVLDGIRARFPNSHIIYAQGTGLVGASETQVPDAVLCADQNIGRRGCAVHGLRAEHYDGVNLQGAPTTAVETNATVAWDNQDRETSTRWTGWITPTESGEFHFRLASQNGYRIWIGDTQVVDEWGVGDAPALTTGAITLQAGHAYPIKVEGVQRAVRGSQRLVWSTPSSNGDDAVAAARAADVVIFVGGLSARVEGEEMRVAAPGFAGGDRTSLDLPAPQENLLERVSAVGKPTVLVLMSGSALSINWADQHVPAIVEAWYPGGQGGAAVASMLAGDFSPAGRLPVTFYKSVDQLPTFTDYSMAHRTYRYFDGEVLYPFGYGLSYTTFSYANARVSRPSVRANGQVVVSVDVTNSGAMDSDEVVELYLTHPGVAGAAIRALNGFQRVHLAHGETKTVQFTLSDRALSIVDPQGVRRIVPGQVSVWVGGGQPTSRAGLAQPAGAATQFRLTSAATLPN